MGSILLKTKRLELRDFVISDWSEVHRYASDPEVIKYVDFGPNTEKESQEFVENCLRQQKVKPRLKYELAVTLSETKQIIGAGAIDISHPEDKGASIGYVFNREYWHKGYGSEVARALVDFAFQKLNLHRVFATCDPENLASARILEKCGMRREGLLLKHKWIPKRKFWRDSFVYAILETEYKPVNFEG